MDSEQKLLSKVFFTRFRSGGFVTCLKSAIDDDL